jgi:hypothetical protein
MEFTGDDTHQTKATKDNNLNLTDVILEILERGLEVKPNHKTRSGLPYNINTGFTVKLKDKK